MSGRQRPRPTHIFSFLFPLISFLFICTLNTQAIDWNSDIVPTAEELENAKKDALNAYFGQSYENGKLFRNFEYMDKLVGKHVDVSLKQ
jgi:hypothetical protein